MPRIRCARCLPVIRCHCHVICLRVTSLPCHHVHCIIMFSKLASAPASSFSPLSVLSPDTLARARGASEYLFYEWPENVLGKGLKLVVWSYYSIGRPPVKFRRIRSSFDSPTVKL